MTDALQARRLHYNETVGTTNKTGDVVFTDPMNKFIDDMIDVIEQENTGDIEICMGDRISGDGKIVLGSRV